MGDAGVTRPTIAVDAQVSTDPLQRTRFARHFLDVIRQVDASDGAVIGLEGEWGSGKTWVLRQLAVLAPEHPDPPLVFVEFNPWLVSGAGDLVAALLAQFAAQLGESSRGVKASKIVESIGAYAGALTALKHVAPAVNLVLPGVGLVVEAVAEGAQRIEDAADPLAPAAARAGQAPSLAALRREVDSLLRKSRKRYVVIVDDLDRIAPAEVASMVQAVKAVASFPNVVYLLAYGRETIAQALEACLHVNDGLAYLEKVVQLEVTLPQVPARHMQRFAIERLRAALPGGPLNLNERADLERSLPIAAALLQTPRDAARLHTLLAVVLPAVVGEINIADVVIAEAVKLKVPAFMEWMRKHADSVVHMGLARYDADLATRHLDPLGGWQFGDSDEERKARNAKLLNELQSLAHASRGVDLPYRQALAFLFDAVQSWESSHASRNNYRRMQRFRHWYRWRCLCDHQEPVTAEQVAALVRDPSRVARDGWLDTADTFSMLCQQVCDLAENDLDGASSVGWLGVVLEAERRFGTDLVVDRSMSYGPAAALEAVLRLDTADDRVATFDAAVRTASLPVAGAMLLDASRQPRTAELERTAARCRLARRAEGSLDGAPASWSWPRSLGLAWRATCARTRCCVGQRNSARPTSRWAVSQPPP